MVAQSLGATNKQSNCEAGIVRYTISQIVFVVDYLSLRLLGFRIYLGKEFTADLFFLHIVLERVSIYSYHHPVMLWKI